MLYPNAIKFSPLKGVSKQHTTCKTQPIAQISILESYGYYLMSSGARYKGVPPRVPCYAI